MGGQHAKEIVYSKEIPNSGDETHTVTWRAATHTDGVVRDFSDGKGDAMGPDVKHPWGTFQRGVKKSLNNPCLGTRPMGSDGTLQTKYDWVSFKQVEDMALKFGSGLIDAGADKVIEFPDEPIAKANRFVGLMSKNRLEWHVTDLACCAFNLCSVPLYDTLGDQALRFILQQTRMCILVASHDQAGKIITLAKAIFTEDPAKQHVHTIILVDNKSLGPKEMEAAQEVDIKLKYYSSVMEDGKASNRPCAPGGPDDLFTICYTSGTTGDPKGVLLTNAIWVGGESGTVCGPFHDRYPFEINPTDTYISYLPLAHVYERIVTHCVLSQGARVGYYSGDVTKIVEDCQILQPTIFCSVPRLYNRINDKISAGVAEKNFVSKGMFNRGLQTKSNAYRNSAKVSDGMWDKIVFGKTKALLGGKIKVMVNGSAPIDPMVQEKINVYFCAPLCQGFGMTETCGIGFVCHPADPITGYVGGPFPNSEVRLESVPDMQYLVTDDPPRGELCLRGSNIFAGYFQNPEATKEALDDEGWLHTGDICHVLPNGNVKVIDRKKNIFKLLQGEYVAPERIEGVYNQCPLISQSFVFGYSQKASLVAIIIPDAIMAKKWRADMDFKKSCASQDPEFIKAIKTEMTERAKICDLKGFEKVKGIHLHGEPFSVDNDMLTPTFKIRRKAAENMFKQYIDELYDTQE